MFYRADEQCCERRGLERAELQFLLAPRTKGNDPRAALMSEKNALVAFRQLAESTLYQQAVISQRKRSLEAVLLS